MKVNSGASTKGASPVTCLDPTDKMAAGPFLALDESVRRVDADGHLHVRRCVLSAAGVSPYWGREIPDHARLSLMPDRIYHIYRPEAVLAAAASSFDGKPILSTHCPVDAAQHPRGLTIGSVGRARLNGRVLEADLTIWDGAAIASIMQGAQRSVSAGYSYRVVTEKGVYGGQAYDLRMHDIRFNHLALVERPRVPEAIIGDSALKLPHDTETLLSSPDASPDLIAPDKMADLGVEAAHCSMPASGQNHRSVTPDRVMHEQKPSGNDMPSHLQTAPSTLLSHREALCSGRSGCLTDREGDNAPRLSSPDVAQAHSAQKEAAQDERHCTENPPPRPQEMTAPVAEGRAIHRPDSGDDPHAAVAQMLEVEAARQSVRPLVGDVWGMDDADAIYRYALTQIDVPACHIHSSALPALTELVVRLHSCGRLATSGIFDVTYPAERLARLSDATPHNSSLRLGGGLSSERVSSASSIRSSQRMTAQDGWRTGPDHLQSVLSGIATPKKI